MRNIVSYLSQRSTIRQAANPDDGLLNIAYNDSSIQYLGRWNDTGTGKWCGWAGRVVVNVRGTGVLYVYCYVIDADSNSKTSIIAFANGSADATEYPLTETLDVYTGVKRAVCKIPLNGIDNKIELYPAMNGPACFAVTQQVIITGYAIGSLGALSTWTQGSKYIETIGDSWSSHVNSFTRLLDTTRYKLFPIANPSFKLSDMNTDYNYNYNGSSLSVDPIMNGIVICSGVNDYIAGVTVPTFQTTLLSLIDKVRVLQPVPIPIFCVRVPNNGAFLYGQYGTAMSNVTGLRANVNYIDTSSLDPSMTFTPTDDHLEGSSKVVYANFVNAGLIAGGL